MLRPKPLAERIHRPHADFARLASRVVAGVVLLTLVACGAPRHDPPPPLASRSESSLLAACAYLPTRSGPVFVYDDQDKWLSEEELAYARRVDPGPNGATRRDGKVWVHPQRLEKFCYTNGFDLPAHTPRMLRIRRVGANTSVLICEPEKVPAPEKSSFDLFLGSTFGEPAPLFYRAFRHATTQSALSTRWQESREGP